ncbi:hypothetical protein [Streptomyces sp. NPDC017991]|uniref:hypothetical protein n=1 Tax=Streptomyces sp. NPDC017991 TaxID=3365026 RepID=UPI00378FB96C
MRAHTEATSYIPSVSAAAVREGRTPLAEVDGVALDGFKGGTATFRLLSGHFVIKSTLR